MSQYVTVVIKIDADDDDTRYCAGMKTSDLPDGEIIIVNFGNALDDDEP